MPAELPVLAQEEDASDILFGAKANIEFVNQELGTNFKVDTLYGWRHRGLPVPLGKFSNHVIGTRRGWRKYFRADLPRAAP